MNTEATRPGGDCQEYTSPRRVFIWRLHLIVEIIRGVVGLGLSYALNIQSTVPFTRSRRGAYTYIVVNAWNMLVLLYWNIDFATSQNITASLKKTVIAWYV